MKRIAMLLMSAVVFLGACSSGPDTEALTEEVQTRLNSQFQPDLLQVQSLRRMGSQSSSDAASGEPRLQVYFNATLEFLQDYDLASWDNLNVATLAHVLGATEKGIIGFKADGNQQGDLLQVHGTSTYKQQNDQWIAIATPASEAVSKVAIALDNTAPRSGAEGLLEQVSAVMKAGETNIRGPEAEIAEEELSLALKRINLRMDREEGVIAISSGEPTGEYFAIARAVETLAKNSGVKVKNYASAGSVENCRLVADRSVDLGLVQNDIAAMAHDGTGYFEALSPMPNLRSLGTLYPEPIQIVTLKSASIQSINDLKGKRIEIGLPNSGTRVNALQVLDAYGLGVDDFAEVTENGLASAVSALESGDIDAFFATLAAPAAELHNLSARTPLRLLSLDPEALEKLTESSPHLVPMTLNANTYPGQDEAARTLSATAMMVTHRDVEDEDVMEFLEALFKNAPALAEETFRGSLVSKQNATRGVSIPLHSGADKFYGG